MILKLLTIQFVIILWKKYFKSYWAKTKPMFSLFQEYIGLEKGKGTETFEGEFKE